MMNKYDASQTITGNLIVSGNSGLAVAGNVEISAGVSYHQVKNAATSTIDWSSGNVQYNDGTHSSYSFSNVSYYIFSIFDFNYDFLYFFYLLRILSEADIE